MLMYMSNSAPPARSTPRHSVSVAGVVVRDDGRMLAIRRADNGTWELPGGVLELTEVPEDGVRREVLEETGIHVEVGGLTGVYKNIAAGVVALVFRCKLSGARNASPTRPRQFSGSRPRKCLSGCPWSTRSGCWMPSRVRGPTCEAMTGTGCSP